MLFDNFSRVLENPTYLKSLIDRVFFHLERLGCSPLQTREFIYDFIANSTQYRCVECIILLAIGPEQSVVHAFDRYELYKFSDIAALKYFMRKIFPGKEKPIRKFISKTHNIFMSLCIKRLETSGFSSDEIAKMSRRERVFNALEKDGKY